MEYSIKYEQYLVDEAFNQIYMDNFINECILFANNESSIVSQIQLLHEEGLKEKLKNMFDKLIETIKKVWGRFVAKCDELIKSNAEYLKKYENIILNTPLEDDKYEMYKYWDGYSSLMNDKVPLFNFSAIKDKNMDQIRQMLGNKYQDPQISLSDKAKFIFRGSKDKESTLLSTQIPMKTLYNYCVEYDALKKAIEKGIAEVEKASDHAITLINQVGTNEATEVYSYFTESFITEAPVTKVGKEETENEEVAKKNQIANGKKETDEQIQKKVKPNTKDAAVQACKDYVMVCTSFLFAKATIAEETYKAYMFIIKDHVKAHVGTEKVNKDKDGEADAKPVKDSSVEKGKSGILQRAKDFISGKNKK